MVRAWILLLLMGSVTMVWANAVPARPSEWAPKQSGDLPLPSDKPAAEPEPTSPWPTAALGLGLAVVLAGGGLVVAARRRRAG